MQFRYALVYVCITFVVLLFLNIYCSGASQRLFYQSKEASMVEKCQLASADIAKLEVLNTTNVSKAINSMEGLRVTRLLVTDQAGVVLYDSYSADSALGSYGLLPEVVQAMEGTNGNDVFFWQYHDGIMLSRVATPIVSFGRIMGCVYMMEADAEYPEYGFASHKGYGSAEHLEALRKYGACPLHRKSFRPVAEVLPDTPVQQQLEF